MRVLDAASLAARCCHSEADGCMKRSVGGRQCLDNQKWKPAEVKGFILFS